MSLSTSQFNLKKQTDLKKISFFTPVLTTLLIVVIFLSLLVVITPVSAAENRNSAGVSKKQESFLNQLSSFVKNPFTTVVLAQGNQNKTIATPKPKQVQKKLSFLQQVWNFITAPYRNLLASSANPTPKPTFRPTPRPVLNPAVKPSISPAPTVVPEPSATGLTLVSTPRTAVLATTATAESIVKSLAAGTKYVDLIGKTIIDSNGNLYPSNAGLGQTTKPSLGTDSNRYYGLFLNNFKISASGDITTGMSGAIVKASSKGVLSSSAVQLDSTEINGTLQAGNGGTGQNAYATGDILYSSATNVLSRLAIGSNDQILTISSGIPSWSGTLSLSSGAFSSTLSISDGSAATPGLNFTNDTDSGLWRIGTNHIALTTAGSALSGVSINSSGNVGIGVTGATTSLQVNGNVMIGYASGAAASLSNGLAVSGNVGIGTTGPGAKLTVIGNVGIGTSAAGSQMAINGGSTIGFGTTSVAAPNNGLGVYGNVGIGTSTANYNLSVVGTANVTGAATLGNTLAVTSTSALTGAVTIAANNAALTFSGTTPSLTSGTSVFGLFAGGNVGIGTTATMGSALNVNGGQVIGSSFIGGAAPANGLGIQGNVGIGTTSPTFQLQTTGDVGIGGSLTVSSVGVFSAGVTVTGVVKATGGFNGLCTETTPAAGANPITCNQDVAEIYPATENVAPGDVLSFDTSTDRSVKKSQGAYDQGLIGIVSTNPGLILGLNGSDVILGGESSSYGKNMDPKRPAVALTGKVPVKVSTENGPIKVGDYLTSSSIPGVAMKATKAGVVVGSALEAYNGDGVGSALVFVKLGYFNGSKLADLIDQSTALVGIQPNLSQQILAKLMSDKQVNNTSELLTDRIAAGVEIITPQLTADNIIAGVIKPLDGKDLTVTLADNQAFAIKDSQNQTAISFDNQGNAYFKGQVVASAVKADRIEGLSVLANEVITGKLSTLVDRISKVEQATSSAVLAASVSQSTLDISTLAKLNQDGGITINGKAEFKGQSVFDALAEFASNVIFKGDVSFIGRIFLPRDSVGTAVIRTGSDSVTIGFARGYDSAPTINVTPTMQSGNDGAGNDILNGSVRFVVQGVSGSGFTIKLNRAASADLVFSWTALATGGNQFTSTTSAAASATPAPAVTPEPSASPVATPTPTPAPTASPVASATPAPAVTPEPSASPVATPTPTPAPTASPVASATPAPAVTPEPSASPVTTP